MRCLAGITLLELLVVVAIIGIIAGVGVFNGRRALQSQQEQAAVRFRPVMLTAITTILGLMPMATGVSFDFKSLTWSIGGESAQWWGPMAVAVVFGLAVATLLTLVVMPVLCSLSGKLPQVAQGLYEPKRES